MIKIKISPEQISDLVIKIAEDKKGHQYLTMDVEGEHIGLIISFRTHEVQIERLGMAKESVTGLSLEDLREHLLQRLKEIWKEKTV